ncbi:hypothetical protein M0R45_027017 [Rubus argutus]|uniref:Uncharacterized protein n=1 Tax=Rubus argutus TaxID=59490 RepID=A0AAW1X1S8_RUBAR
METCKHISCHHHRVLQSHNQSSFSLCSIKATTFASPCLCFNQHSQQPQTIIIIANFINHRHEPSLPSPRLHHLHRAHGSLPSPQTISITKFKFTCKQKTQTHRDHHLHKYQPPSLIEAAVSSAVPLGAQIIKCPASSFPHRSPLHQTPPRLSSLDQRRRRPTKSTAPCQTLAVAVCLEPDAPKSAVSLTDRRRNSQPSSPQSSLLPLSHCRRCSQLTVQSISATPPSLLPAPSLISNEAAAPHLPLSVNERRGEEIKKKQREIKTMSMVCTGSKRKEKNKLLRAKIGRPEL